MHIMKNPDGCRLDYQAMTRQKIEELREYRQMAHTKDIYLWSARMKLLTDLFGLQKSWQDLSGCFSGGSAAKDPNAAYKVIYESIFLKNQLPLMTNEGEIERLMDEEPTIGPISFSRLRQIADRAAGGDNQSAEEFEFCIVAHAVILPMSLYWAAMGMCGLSRAKAFLQVVDFIPVNENKTFLSKWMDDFDSFLNCAYNAANAIVGGANGATGTYSPLPPLW